MATPRQVKNNPAHKEVMPGIWAGVVTSAVGIGSGLSKKLKVVPYKWFTSENDWVYKCEPTGQQYLVVHPNRLELVNKILEDTQ